MYIARDKDGTLMLYDNYPLRDNKLGLWYDPSIDDHVERFIRFCFNIDPAAYKDVTWESDPVEVFPILVRAKDAKVVYIKNNSGTIYI